ncbi:killer cell lectin-like receptor 7 [Nannospalax galili]|uniref:killer cell lectin-like receptor 7 n=1 Tax=Nannospalax galili TaxID=1026970 RepID=UPI000819A53D|nr:killer cell lectin-like receptor 7 [Nannospalax galili]
MSNQEVTYTTVRFLQSPLELQNRVRSGDTEEPREADHKGKRLEGHWFCFGTKCYYFIMDSKTWNGCTQTCCKCSLSLLKIDDRDERDFLWSQVNGTSYWIGLSYDKQEKKWNWTDSGSSNLDLPALNLQGRDGKCAFFTSTRIDNSDCGKTYPCICEKRMDTLSDSVCNKKERYMQVAAEDQ